MQDLPHHYRVTATGEPAGTVNVASPGLDDLATAAPAEFGGPGDQWSPETLFAAAIADCFVLSFRAVARASRLTWRSLQCDVEAVLERVDGTTRFTRVNLAAELPRSACLVHHGGLGTTEQALWNGTPQLIAPRHVEQQLNGSAIQTHQCGLTLTSETRQQPEAVAAALQTLASDTNTRGAALALARELRNTTPQGSLSAVVEACLKR